MIGFIYHITNKDTGKKYIGQTTDIEDRIRRHFKELEKGTHHSQKLQRSYNIHGKDAFVVSYIQKEYEDYLDLLADEEQEISKYNSYDNGYNCTRGGEGHSTLFDFNTSVLIYNIGLKYDGVIRKLARYYKCDRTSISAVFNKKYLGMITFEEEELNKLIEQIGLTEENLKENYINNYSKQLDQDKILKILSTIEIKKYSGAACAKVYGVSKDTVSNIIRGKIYKNEFAEFKKLTQEQKEKIAEEFCNTTDVIRLHYEGQRGPVKNPLTQDQVNYILDGVKDGKKVKDIAIELNISNDRVSSVKNRKSYLDMIWVYEKEHS